MSLLMMMHLPETSPPHIRPGCSVPTVRHRFYRPIVAKALVMVAIKLGTPSELYRELTMLSTSVSAFCRPVTDTLKPTLTAALAKIRTGSTSGAMAALRMASSAAIRSLAAPVAPSDRMMVALRPLMMFSSVWMSFSSMATSEAVRSSTSPRTPPAALAVAVVMAAVALLRAPTIAPMLALTLTTASRTTSSWAEVAPEMVLRAEAKRVERVQVSQAVLLLFCIYSSSSSQRAQRTDGGLILSQDWYEIIENGIDGAHNSAVSAGLKGEVVCADCELVLGNRLDLGSRRCPDTLRGEAEGDGRGELHFGKVLWEAERKGRRVARIGARGMDLEALVDACDGSWDYIFSGGLEGAEGAFYIRIDREARRTEQLFVAVNSKSYLLTVLTDGSRYSARSAPLVSVPWSINIHSRPRPSASMFCMQQAAGGHLTSLKAHQSALG